MMPVFVRTCVPVKRSSCLQHAHALELLSAQLYEGATALDVGSGSGYLTACMALLVRSGLAYLYSSHFLASSICIVLTFWPPLSV